MDGARKESDRKQNFLIGASVFILALAVRLLAWHDFRLEARNVQTGVTYFYKLGGQLLLDNGINSFFSSSSPLSTPELLGHPPGYPFLLAGIFYFFGDRDAPIQLTQVACDAFGCVVVLFIAAALLPRAVAVIAGALTAVAPQFSYNSVMLLPDSLAVLPILLAVYCLVRARTRPRLLTFVAAGVLIGASGLMRANAILLALAIPILFERGKQFRYGAALILGAVLVIAPVTIRNFIVYGELIPLSLGAGQTLLEGIADYDEEGDLDSRHLTWASGGRKPKCITDPTTPKRFSVQTELSETVCASLVEWQ